MAAARACTSVWCPSIDVPLYRVRSCDILAIRKLCNLHLRQKSARFYSRAVTNLEHQRQPDNSSTKLIPKKSALSYQHEQNFATAHREVTTVSPARAIYQFPQTGFLSILPKSWIPYAELMRLEKPAGTYYLFFPCLFSTLLAASYTHSGPVPLMTTTLYFFSGALIMRGAGCTINDLWDRNLDPHVVRTRLRPIARGAISPFNALVFTGFQLLIGLRVLLQFPTSCLYYGVPSLLFVATYPLAKRVTHYPQFVLGLTFSWGAIMGFPSLGVDLISDTSALQAVATLYGSCVAWTVLYDMIYAHMDIKDDAKVGIKSIALRHEKETKAVLSGLAVVQLGLLASAGVSLSLSPIFFVGSCGSAAASLGLMIWKVDLKNVSSCWWWFKNGALFTGGSIASGMLAEYLLNERLPLEVEEANVIEESHDGEESRKILGKSPPI